MHRIYQSLIFCLPILLTSGCIAYSQNPVSDAQTAVVEEALLGQWQSPGENGEKLDLDVTREGEHKVLIALTSVESDGEHREHIYHAHASTAEDARYLNVYQSEDTRAFHGYMIAKYETTDAGELKIALLNDDAAKKAIVAGNLEGLVSVGSEYADATITAAAVDLAVFLREHATEMFPKTIVFTRRK